MATPQRWPARRRRPSPPSELRAARSERVGGLAYAAVAEANAEQHAYWNQKAGPTWVANQERLDQQIRPHGELALAALAAAAGERVLDLGCGCGDTSLVLAERVGPSGAVLGVDLSEPMLARARERAAAAGRRRSSSSSLPTSRRPGSGTRASTPPSPASA